jgi:hypothetical protein
MAEAEVAVDADVAEAAEAQQADLPASDPAEEMAGVEEQQEQHIDELGEQPMPCLRFMSCGRCCMPAAK